VHLTVGYRCMKAKVEQGGEGGGGGGLLHLGAQFDHVLVRKLGMATACLYHRAADLYDSRRRAITDLSAPAHVVAIVAAVSLSVSSLGLQVLEDYSSPADLVRQADTGTPPPRPYTLCSQLPLTLAETSTPLCSIPSGETRPGFLQTISKAYTVLPAAEQPVLVHRPNQNCHYLTSCQSPSCRHGSRFCSCKPQI